MKETVLNSWLELGVAIQEKTLYSTHFSQASIVLYVGLVEAIVEYLSIEIRLSREAC